MGALGRPTPQTVIARIESGSSTRARNVTLDEAFAFAAALGVSLLALLNSPDRAIEVATGLQLHPYIFRAWTTGAPLTRETLAISESEFDQPPLDVAAGEFDGLDVLYPGEREFILAALEREEDYWRGYLQFTREHNPEALATIEQRTEERLRRLQQAREKLERKGERK
jgi:hypothetical protein